ncbi:GNAT family N-acetyltransferase [Kitasatospora sp. NBC_00374]|uniref:GNAT family N-acetyltransferase n=1 Tax=Kitasatospora sp. NBC_00374 TaxID=2975964 RepID=UPI003254E22C
MAYVRQRSLGTLPAERLDLVPLRVDHAEEMAAVLADPALHTYTGGAPDSPEELRARYRRLAAGSPEPETTWHNWVIHLREDGCLAGYVQATVTGRTAELAWVVGTPWQGRGIATEAVRAAAVHLTAGQVDTLVAHIHPDHHASAAVATALGLTPTDLWYDGERRWQS